MHAGEARKRGLECGKGAVCVRRGGGGEGGKERNFFGGSCASSSEGEDFLWREQERECIRMNQ